MLYVHRHFYRLRRAWHHPPGYLFYCVECDKKGLHPWKFITYADFWGKRS